MNARAERAAELRAALTNGEWFCQSDIAERFGRSRQAVNTFMWTLRHKQGVKFEKRRIGLRQEFRAKVRRSKSKELVHVPRAHPIVNGRGRVGPGAAAASLAPSLDASLTVDLLKREADGSITVGMVNGSMRYLFALTGAIPMEMAEP